MKQIKVYQFNIDGWREGVMATTSMAKVAKAFGVSPRRVTMYGSETGNAEDVEAAMAQPETPLVRASFRETLKPWEG